MKLNLYALSFACGAYLVWFLPGLIPVQALYAVLLYFFAALKFRPLMWLAVFFIGLSWGIYQSNNINQTQIPLAPAGIETRLSGVVSSIPQDRGISQRFEFRVEKVQGQVETKIESAGSIRPEKLLLSWYQLDTPVQVGDRYQFDLKLRRPRGLSNFGQFDYRRWLLGQGVDATGYVRRAEYLGGRSSLLDRINQFRVTRQSQIKHQNFQHSELIVALGLGLKESIQASQWQLFLETGVIHLMVISGLHIGFAALIGFSISGILAKPLLALGWLRSDLALRWIGSVLSAACYACLAGLSLPTLRALVMLVLFAFCRCRRLAWSGWTILCLSLAIFALLQPAAVLQEGFWLSFGAVTVLVVSFSGRSKLNFFSGLVRAQLMLLIGFGGLLLVLNKTVFPAGLVANLLAVPLTGFFLVPLIFTAILLLPHVPEFSFVLLHWVDSALGLLLDYLELISHVSLLQVKPSFSSSLSALLICLTSLVFVIFPSWKARVMLAFVFIPFVFGFRTEKPELSLLVFDVGQGTAVLVEQPGYRLLYDTGPAFSREFNAGSDILLPHIQRESNRLNSLVVSHDDSDHAGGFPALKSELEIAELFVGGARLYQEGADLHADYCRAGFSWNIGPVSYRFLYPQNFSSLSSSNNQSCVLLIEYGQKQILLAGDIEQSVEVQLMTRHPRLSNIDWLLVPHHGSKSSSSNLFVVQFSPDMAVVSAGYGNSFGHPASEVVSRYRSVGSKVFNTAEHGAMRFSWWDESSPAEFSASRGNYRYWWQE